MSNFTVSLYEVATVTSWEELAEMVSEETAFFTVDDNLRYEFLAYEYPDLIEYLNKYYNVDFLDEIFLLKKASLDNNLYICKNAPNLEGQEILYVIPDM